MQSLLKTEKNHDWHRSLLHSTVLKQGNHRLITLRPRHALLSPLPAGRRCAISSTCWMRNEPWTRATNSKIW